MVLNEWKRITNSSLPRNISWPCAKCRAPRSISLPPEAATNSPCEAGAAPAPVSRLHGAPRYHRRAESRIRAFRRGPPALANPFLQRAPGCPEIRNAFERRAVDGLIRPDGVVPEFLGIGVGPAWIVYSLFCAILARLVGVHCTGDGPVGVTRAKHSVAFATDSQLPNFTIWTK